MDGHSYSGILGYSDMGEGWTSLDYPWMVTVTPAYRNTLTWGRGGGVPGLSVDGHSYSSIQGASLDYPWMATVTPAYRDTLTWGGGGVGDHPWTICGWSQLLSAKYKGTVSSMDGSGLSTAPLDISVFLLGWINLYSTACFCSTSVKPFTTK